MFLIEIITINLLLLGYMPESAALLLCGISLIGGTAVARRILKHKTIEEEYEAVNVTRG